jgi:hypothetical protein
VICNVRRDLKDSTGAYLKSVCTVYQDVTYDIAAQLCIGNDMKLFEAKSEETMRAINKYSDVQWPYGSFWIDGPSTSGCSIVTNDNRVNYDESESACTKKNYFNCEYGSKFEIHLDFKKRSLILFFFRQILHQISMFLKNPKKVSPVWIN